MMRVHSETETSALGRIPRVQANHHNNEESTNMQFSMGSADLLNGTNGSDIHTDTNKRHKVHVSTFAK